MAATAKVSDESAPEVLIMDPNGKLRFSRVAATPPTRTRRAPLEVRARVREVIDAIKKAGDGGTASSRSTSEKWFRFRLVAKRSELRFASRLTIDSIVETRASD